MSRFQGHHLKSEAQAELEWQLKAARICIENLMASEKTAWETVKAKANANPSTISKAQWHKLQKTLHPDHLKFDRVENWKGLAQLRLAGRTRGALACGTISLSGV